MLTLLTDRILISTAVMQYSEYTTLTLPNSLYTCTMAIGLPNRTPQLVKQRPMVFEQKQNVD